MYLIEQTNARFIYVIYVYIHIYIYIHIIVMRLKIIIKHEVASNKIREYFTIFIPHYYFHKLIRYSMNFLRI